MNDTTRKVTEDFIEDLNNAQKLSKWDGYTISASMAAVMIDSGHVTSIDTMKEAAAVIKKTEGVFSNMRAGYARGIINAVVAQADDKDQAVADIKRIHDLLKPGVFSSFEYDIAACLIYMCNKDGNYERTIERTLQIAGEIGSGHPFLGSDRQLSDCVLIAMTDKDPVHAAIEYEECYKELVKIYGKGSITLRAAAAMSLFGGGTDIRAERVKALHQELKQAKFHFTTEGIEMIAYLSGKYGDQAKNLISEMQEVSDMLSKEKAFGSWGLGSKIRNLFAAAIVICALTDDPKEELYAKQILLNILCYRRQQDDAAATYVAIT